MYLSSRVHPSKVPHWRQLAVSPFRTSVRLAQSHDIFEIFRLKFKRHLKLFFLLHIKLQSFIFTLAYVYFNGRSWRGNWRREENYNRLYLPSSLWHENASGGRNMKNGTFTIMKPHDLEDKCSTKDTWNYKSLV
jgi:hypothetical protein